MLRGDFDPVYDAVMAAAEHHDEWAAATSDPSNLVHGGLGLGLLAGAIYVGRRARVPLRNHLTGSPGEIVAGRRADSRRDALLGCLVVQRLVDRMMHNQVVGPTGQGKTTLLLNLAVQDLGLGLTVFVMETGGDLGERLIPYARALGRPVFNFDLGAQDSWKWNPLAGDPERAAEQAVSTMMIAGASNDDFFKNFNAAVMRRMVFAAHAHGEWKGVNPTLGLVDELLTDERFMNDALGVVRDGGGGGRKRRDYDEPVTLNNPCLTPDTKRWFEKRWFGIWGRRQRSEFTSGLQASLDMVLGRRLVKSALSPTEGERHVDMGAALSSGGLVLFRMPQGPVGPAASRALALWVLQRFQQEVLDRGRSAYPVIAYLDEVHNTLGHANEAAATDFSSWLAQARHFNTGVYLSYQSFEMLPPVLKAVVANNAHNKFVSGGLDPHDATEAQAMMGFVEQEVTDVRHTRRPLTLHPSTVSVGKREQEKARYSVWEIREIPRGSWLVQLVRNGRLQAPTLMTAPLAPPVPRRRTRRGWGSPRRGGTPTTPQSQPDA